MSRKKAPSPPKFQQNPFVNQNLQQLTQLGQRVSGFDFTGALAPLQQTIQLNPQIIQSALSQAQGLLQPQFRQLTQDITNQAAAANQLGTSTFTDALARAQENISSQFQAIVSGAAIGSAQQALQNRISLLGIGSNISGGALQGALGAQGQVNQFNQQNFQNQLAAFGANQRGGFTGALTGAIGGGLAGAAFGGVPGAILGGLGGGFAGGLGAPGTGGSLLQTGALSRALRGPTSVAGQTAGFGSGNVSGTGLFGSRLFGRTQSEILGFPTGSFRSATRF